MALILTSVVSGFSKIEVSYAAGKAPKYVFYFIGDGLGASQRQIAEYFKQEVTGEKDAKLLMNTFPVAGINTTYSADSLVTDSAAAGTALATGHKTNNGFISQTPDGDNLRTLIEEAEEKGMATGIITTTRLTHATPAVFASHNENRNNENEIAADYLDSGVDFIAGGGYRHFVPKDWKWGKSKRKDDRNILQEFYEKGYRVFVGEHDTKAFRNYNPKVREKVIATFTYSHMPYEIDRKNRNDVPSLVEMTEKGIEVLSKYKNGFFLMVEGGRIDHACHANDPVGAIHDTLEFDEAIKEAYEFYKKHPNETLIVVVGDHETGGMGLGFGKNYFLKLDELTDAKLSTADVLNYENPYEKGDNRAEYFAYIEKNLGLDNLTEAERKEIEKAMDIVDNGIEDKAGEYGGYNPVAIAVTHILSERANIQWTTYAHSGVSIPMSAIGVGAEEFSGYKDNTEIAKAMAKLMGFELTK
ncbi:alkaline phosphatase [Thermohalobacter berrensis]|uniref:Alkaline phosphatase n=2 Tax=Thermohalobacter berrensis TaxID=99594 RepID=A0A419T3R6_9FIRM|nr:alkaline phosphatase [Thermohalobacter berrensis]